MIHGDGDHQWQVSAAWRGAVVGKLDSGDAIREGRWPAVGRGVGIRKFMRCCKEETKVEDEQRSMGCGWLYQDLAAPVC